MKNSRDMHDAKEKLLSDVQASDENSWDELTIEKEEIRRVLTKNLDEIVEKLHTPGKKRKIWIHGKLGKDDITVGYQTQGTKPDPANYDEDEWHISKETWTTTSFLRNDGLSDEEYRKEKDEEEPSHTSMIARHLQLNRKLEEWAESARFPGR